MRSFPEFFEASNEYTPEQLEKIAPLVRIKQVAKGEILLRRGETNTKGYFVMRGCLRSYVIDDKGKEHIFMFVPAFHPAPQTPADGLCSHWSGACATAGSHFPLVERRIICYWRQCAVYGTRSVCSLGQSEKSAYCSEVNSDIYLRRGLILRCRYNGGEGVPAERRFPLRGGSRRFTQMKPQISQKRWVGSFAPPMGDSTLNDPNDLNDLPNDPNDLSNDQNAPNILPFPCENRYYHLLQPVGSKL